MQLGWHMHPLDLMNHSGMSAKEMKKHADNSKNQNQYRHQSYTTPPKTLIKCYLKKENNVLVNLQNLPVVEDPEGSTEKTTVNIIEVAAEQNTVCVKKKDSN